MVRHLTAPHIGREDGLAVAPVLLRSYAYRVHVHVPAVPIPVVVRA
jgi:hypothetical protein